MKEIGRKEKVLIDIYNVPDYAVTGPATETFKFMVADVKAANGMAVLDYVGCYASRKRAEAAALERPLAIVVDRR